MGDVAGGKNVFRYSLDERVKASSDRIGETFVIVQRTYEETMAWKRVRYLIRPLNIFHEGRATEAIWIEEWEIERAE